MDFSYIIYLLVAVLLAYFIIKKVAGCVIRIVLIAIVIAVLVALSGYFG